jgi:hypothetical protein
MADAHEHGSLAAQRPGRRGDPPVNVRFAEHDARGSIGAYLDELGRARRAAQRRTDAALAAGDPATTLGLEFRYALMAASVVDLDRHLPGELLARLAAPPRPMPQRSGRSSSDMPSGS